MGLSPCASSLAPSGEHFPEDVVPRTFPSPLSFLVFPAERVQFCHPSLCFFGFCSTNSPQCLMSLVAEGVLCCDGKLHAAAPAPRGLAAPRPALLECCIPEVKGCGLIWV